MALNIINKSLWVDLQPEGFRCVVLHPGWVATDMGTPQAPLQPDEVARGLWRVLGNLDSSGSGCFIDWKGDPVPW